MVPEDAGVEPETAEEYYMVTICQLRDSFGSKVQRSHRPHITDPRPPMATKAPVQAHERLECMSFGVMSSKHNPGSVPAGMTKDN